MTSAAEVPVGVGADAGNAEKAVAGVATALLSLAAAVSGLGWGLLSLWWTYIAFFGGRMPLLGVRTAGGVGWGLLWLLILTPTVIGIAEAVPRIIGYIVAAPFLLLFRTSSVGVLMGATAYAGFVGLGAYAVATGVHLSSATMGPVAVIDNSGVCKDTQAFVTAANNNDAASAQAAFAQLQSDVQSATDPQLKSAAMTVAGFSAQTPAGTVNGGLQQLNALCNRVRN